MKKIAKYLIVLILVLGLGSTAELRVSAQEDDMPNDQTPEIQTQEQEEIIPAPTAEESTETLQVPSSEESTEPVTVTPADENVELEADFPSAEPISADNNEDADTEALLGTSMLASPSAEPEMSLLAAPSVYLAGVPDTDTGEEEDTDEGSVDTMEGKEATTSTPAVEEQTAENIIENAIQKQIEDAVAGAGEGDVYVNVENGEYDGDLNIAKSKLDTIGEKTIYVLAPGSYTENDDGSIGQEITSGADGSVRMNGNVNIDGIKVVLAGIYFSLGNKVSVKDSETELYGTTLDDNITVELQENAKVEVHGGDGADTLSVEGKELTDDEIDKTESVTGSRTVTLEGDAGSNLYEVDLSAGGDEKNESASDATPTSPTNVTIKSTSDSDRVHFSGTLQDGEPADKSSNSKIETEIKDSSDTVQNTVTYVQSLDTDKYKFNLLSTSNRKSNGLDTAVKNLRTVVTTEGIKNFTDELENKIEREIAYSDIESDVIKSGIIDDRSFVNYVYNSSNTINISVSQADATNVAANTKLTQLVLENTAGKVNVGNVTTNGTNLLIRGDSINITGEVNTGAGNLVVRAKDSDTNIDINTSPVAKPINTLVGSNKVPYNIKLSVFSIKSTADINVANTANLNGRDIDIKSYSKQNKPLVPFTNTIGADFVSVKVSDALINIAGNITSTMNFIGRAISTITSTASNEALAKWYIPVATAVLLGEASLVVREAAAIAAATIKLLSDSQINVKVASTVGSLPVSIAVSALTNDSKVEITDSANVKAKTGNVSTQASGKMIATTKSHAKNKETEDDAKNKKKDGETEDKDKSENQYGGFISVAVALQDVSVNVLKNAQVSSEKKDVYMLSSALESVVTSAISAVPSNVPKKDGSADTNNGAVAKDNDEKSDAGDESDKRSVENSQQNAENLLEAAKNPDKSEGKTLSSKDTDKIEKLKKGVKGSGSSDKESDKDAKTSKDDEDDEFAGLAELFDESSQSADVKKDTGEAKNKSALQLTGAFVVNVVSNRNKVYVETTDGIYALSGKVSFLADELTVSKAVANATQVNDKDSDKNVGKNALGAAVAVNVTKNYNLAEINNAQINADKLDVIANSGAKGFPVLIYTEAIAGISDAKDGFGVGGAVAIDVATIKNRALVGSKALFDIQGEESSINVKANSAETIKTKTKSNVKIKGDNAKLGVGPAISVAVNGIDVVAAVGDTNASVSCSNADSISVTVDHKLDEAVEATSGAESALAVSPSVTVDVSGVHAESYTYLKPTDSAVTMIVLPGNFTQDAKSSVERTLSADASAKASNSSGTTTGSGTLIVSVLNDSTVSTAKSSLKANNISVTATGKSNLKKGLSRASSHGSKPAKKEEGGSDGDGSEEGDADKQADEAIDGAKKLSDKVDSENVNTSTVSELTDNRQKGQTTEGNVSVAAAFVVNIFKNVTKAELIGDFISATTSEEDDKNGKIKVISTNETNSYIFADSSAVAAKCDSDGKVQPGDGTGVGVSVAIGVITVENKAVISTKNDLEAGAVTVKAITHGTKKEKDAEGKEKEVNSENTIKTYSVSGAGAPGVGVAGSIAISILSGNTEAYIWCENNGVPVKLTASEGNVEVNANIMQNEETIATASMKKSGEPDKNDSDEDKESKEADEDSKQVEDKENGEQVAEVDDNDESNKGGEDKSSTENEAPEKDENNNAKNPKDKGKSKPSYTAVGVGASFAMNISSQKALTEIRAKEIKTEELTIEAKEELKRNTYSVAGNDPLSKGASDVKANKAVDASIALMISKDQTKTIIDKYNALMVKASGDVSISSTHNSTTVTKSSGFAIGNQSAIGAAIALNIAKADVITSFDGNIEAEGEITIESNIEDNDRSVSMATAMGTKNDKAKEDSGDQPESRNDNNDTAKTVVKELNENKSEKATGDAKASKAFSTNVLKTQGAKTESTKDDSEVGKAIKEAEDTANEEATNKDKAGAGKIEDGVTDQEETAVNVAAAVGINIVIHKANINVAGHIVSLGGKDISIKASGNEQFSTLGTALTMTQLPAKGAVAVGVAIAINKNEAIVNLGKKDSVFIVGTSSEDKRSNITISSELEQNNDNSYMATQAVAGSIAKKAGTDKTNIAAAGAIAILISNSQTKVNTKSRIEVNGKAIEITAHDNYKLQIRAGSLNYAKKANAGVGAAFGMLYVNDQVYVDISSNSIFDGANLKIEARRDYEENQIKKLLGYIGKAMDLYSSYTDNKVVQESINEDGSKEVKLTNPDLKSMDTGNIALNAINIFINDTYHIESFSGSYAGGEGTLNASGAVALAFLRSSVDVLLGRKITINIHKIDDKTKSGVSINAIDTANSALYSIGVAGGSAKTNAGASIAVVIDNGITSTSIADSSTINISNDGGFTFSARTTQNNLVVTVAAAVTNKDNGVGGNVNVFVSKHNTEAALSTRTTVIADKDVNITADYDSNALLIAASAQGSKKTAAGGVISVGIYNAATKTLVGRRGSVAITSNKGSVNIKAHAAEKLLAIVASASAAVSAKAGVAAVISVLIGKSVTRVETGEAKITANAGDVNITADNTSIMRYIDAALAIAGGGVAAGGVVCVIVLKRTIETIIGDGSKITTAGNVLISANAVDELLEVLANGGAGRNSFGGIISVTVQNNTVKAMLGEITSINAKGSVGISAYLDAVNYLIAGGLNVGTNNSVGGIINTVVITNTIESSVGNYTDIYSGGTKALVMPSVSNGSDNRKRKIRGVSVDAGENAKSRIIGISGAGSGNIALTGVINTVVSNSKVRAHARSTGTSIKAKSEGGAKDTEVPLAIEVVAYSNTDVVDAAGSLSASGNVGVGVSVVVFTYAAEVSAILECKQAESDGNIRVEAFKNDRLFLVAISLAGSGSVAVSAAPDILVYKNVVKASVPLGTLTAVSDVTVKSTATSDINMIAAVVSGSGTAAVSLAGDVIYFYNDNQAILGSNAKGDVNAKNIYVLAITSEKLNADAAGLAGSGAAAVGGAADIVITNVISKAILDVKTATAEYIEVYASDDYNFLAIVGTLAGSGAAGIGVSVLVSVSHNTILAQIGPNAQITATNDVIVKAISNRQIQSFVASIGIGGGAGIGGSVAVIVAGKGIDKDSSETVTKANPEKLVTEAFANSDNRAQKAVSVSELRSELNSSISPNKGSAKELAAKGGENGNYDSYGNGNKKLSNDLVSQTSSNLKSGLSDSTDTTMAIVGENAKIKANSVEVHAKENVSAMGVIAGAGGGTAGVGASVAVVIIGSNVKAITAKNSNITTTGIVRIIAELTQEKKEWNNDLTYSPAGSSGKSNMKDVINKKESVEKESTGSSKASNEYGILLITGAVGGGVAGVGVNVVYFNNTADVEAITQGVFNYTNSTKSSVEITADADMGNIGVFSVTLGAGAVGVATSVAIANAETKVRAAFDPDKDQAESNLQKADLVVDAKAIANLTTVNAAIGAGAVGVAAIVAIANNRIDSSAYIGKYAKITTSNDGRVTVNSEVNGNVNAYMGNLTAGAVAVGVSVIIANNKADNNAYVGIKESESQQGTNGAYINTGYLNVTATSKGDIYVVGASVAAGAVAANGTVTLGIQNVTNVASIKNIDLRASMDLAATARMDGSVRLNVASLSAGFIGAGAVVAESLITSTNKAYIGGDGEIHAGALRVRAGGAKSDDLSDEYSTTAVTTVATGAAGAIAGAFNYAYAENNANNIAILAPNGKVEAVSVSAQARGTATALAVAANVSVGGAAINATSSRAELTGLSKAEIVTGPNSEFKTETIYVSANHNTSTTKAGSISFDVKGTKIKVDPKAAAEAWLFSGAAGIAAKNVNKAYAKADNTVIANAEFNGKRLEIQAYSAAGTAVRVNAASTAYAKSTNMVTAGISVGLVEVEAIAAGNFKATFVNKALDSIVRFYTFIIATTFTTQATSELEPSKSGVSSSVGSAEANSAVAKATTVAEASGKGNITQVRDRLTINSTGTVNASARIFGAIINISGASLAANFVNSEVSVKNKAFYEGLGGSVTARNMDVIAKLTDVTSYAQGGPSSSGLNLTLLGAGITKITATSDITNEAYLVDANLSIEESLKVLANTGNLNDAGNTMQSKAVHVSAIADAPDYSVGAASAQGVIAYTDESSNIFAGIRGKGAISAGSIVITAAENSEVTSKGSAPKVSVTLSSGDSIIVITEAGKKKAREVLVKLENGTIINTSTKNFEAYALSDLSIAAKLNPMTNIGGIKLGSYHLATDVGKSRTAVEIGCDIDSYNGIIITAKDNINSIIDRVEIINGGLLGGTDSRVEGNIRDQIAEVIIGKSGNQIRLTSGLDDIKIYAITTARMRTDITSSSYGLGTKSNIAARNNYKRTTRVAITDDVTIESNGNIEIFADAQNADIESKAIGSAGGGVQKAIPTAQITYNADTIVDIGGNNQLISRYAMIKIIAQTTSTLVSKAEYTMTGGIESNRPSASITSVENVNVNIAKDSNKQTIIAGADVEISAYVLKQKHEANARAMTKSFATYTEATTKIKSNNNLNIEIGNADISGFETLHIYSLVQTLNDDSIAFGSIKGVTGKVYSNSDISGGTVSNITIGNDKYRAILRGPQIIVNNTFSSDFDSKINREAVADGQTIVNKVTQVVKEVQTVVEKITSWLPWPLKNLVRYITRTVTKYVTKVIEVVTYSDCEAKKTGTYTKDGLVKVNMDLYSGEFGAGVNIRLTNSSLNVTGTGSVRNEEIITVNQDSMTVHDLKATKSGKFTILAFEDKAKGNIKLFNSSYIPSLTIENLTSKTLYLKDIFMLGDTKLDVPIEIKTPKDIEFSYGIGNSPVVNIISLGGNVVFAVGKDTSKGEGIDLDVGEGSLIVSMHGGGNVYTESKDGKKAFVAGNSISIYGAEDIGSEDNPFNVFLFDVAPFDIGEIHRDGRQANLNMIAANNIWVDLTPVRMLANAVKVDSGDATFNINSLNANKVVLTVKPSYIATVREEGGAKPEFYGTIRAYWKGQFNAKFLFGDIVAGQFKVVSNPNDMSSYYYNSLPNTKMNIGNLETIMNGKSYWFKNDSGKGGSDTPSKGGRNDIFSPSIIERLNKKPIMKPIKSIPIINLKKELDIRRRLTDDYIRTRYSGIYPGINQVIGRNMRLLESIDYSGIIKNLFASKFSAYSFFRVVQKNGWSYILVANRPVVGSMLENLSAGALTQTVKEALVGNIYASIAGVIISGSLLSVISGFNMLYIMIAIIMALIIFLILTRKKKEREE